MADGLYVDPKASPGDVIKVNGACYQRVGMSDISPDTFSDDIEGNFDSCISCKSSSSSSSSGSITPAPCTCPEDLPTSYTITLPPGPYVVCDDGNSRIIYFEFSGGTATVVTSPPTQPWEKCLWTGSGPFIIESGYSQTCLGDCPDLYDCDPPFDFGPNPIEGVLGFQLMLLDNGVDPCQWLIGINWDDFFASGSSAYMIPIPARQSGNSPAGGYPGGLSVS